MIIYKYQRAYHLYIVFQSLTEMAENRKKSSNWGDRETGVLLSEVLVVYDTLMCKLSTSVNLAQKKRLWDGISVKVNAVGGQGRDVNSCKKRWRDLKSLYLQKKSHAAQTGGGKPAPPCPYDDIIGQILGENTNLVGGIAGGFESLPETESEPTGLTGPTADHNEGEDTPKAAMTTDNPREDWDFPTELGDTSTLTQDTSMFTQAPSTSTSTSAYITSTPAPLREPAVPLSTSTPQRHVQKRATEANISTTAQPPKTKLRSTFATFVEEDETNLTKKWLQSEIDKNITQTELNKSQTELNKSQTELNNSQKELNELLKVKAELEIAQLRALQKK